MTDKAAEQRERERRDAERAAAISQLRQRTTPQALVLQYVPQLGGLGALESVSFAIIAASGQVEKAALIAQAVSWAFERNPPKDWDHQRVLEWEVERIIDQLAEAELLLCVQPDGGGVQVMLSAEGVQVAIAHRIPVAGLRAPVVT